jgi:hypothetical protein
MSTKGSFTLIGICAALAFIALSFLVFTTVMIYVLIGLGVILVLAGGGFLVRRWQHSGLPVKEAKREDKRLEYTHKENMARIAIEEDARRHQAELERERQEQELKLAARWAYVTEHLALTRIPVDQYGTTLINQAEAHLIHIAPVHKPIAAKEVMQLPAGPAITRPTQEAIIAQLPYNEYMVSPGANALTGEIVVVSLLNVPHVKFIGAPGFGKSCLAGSILDQVTQTNDRQHLQLALLDCEHKTSKLFEHNSNIAQVRINGRIIDLVATDADMVAVQLGFLKREMLRRAQLSEAELDGQPVLLMYVEEMLSLQYEVDPKLLQQMVDDILILAVRARKYRMFLLSCMQTDYSTDEMKVSQKMFRLRGAAAIDPSAARAAGFQNTELVKANFAQGQKGQFVIEYPGFSNIVLVPGYDVKKKLQQLGRPDIQQTSPYAPVAGDEAKKDECPDTMIVDADRYEMEELQSRPENVRTFPKGDMSQPLQADNPVSEQRTKQYRLSDIEIEKFITAFKLCNNREKALNAINRGSSYREHAEEIIRAHNLRKEA